MTQLSAGWYLSDSQSPCISLGQVEGTYQHVAKHARGKTSSVSISSWRLMFVMNPGSRFFLINRLPLFCIHSILSIIPSIYGFQIVAPYCIVGLTRIEYFYYYEYICCFSTCYWYVPQVPSEKPQGNVGFLADVGNVSTPLQVIWYSETFIDCYGWTKVNLQEHVQEIAYEENFEYFSVWILYFTDKYRLNF